ncbi:MAG: dihydrolipoyl dehydrogenase [Porphyromonadaceae bacterium]|nr:dihydrolipoyl dehydrogenase [Porphyromonadaceae bacterium]
MATEIIMPKMGIDMTEGEIVRWVKQEGESVSKGDIILEIMTDKTSAEVEAEADGVLLKIIHGDGKTVPIAEVIGFIGEAGESLDTVRTKEEILPDAPAPAPSDTSGKLPLIRMEGDYHVAVIGGGPAGYVAAIKAAQLGAKVAIVEKSEFGGTCLNKGCIPTKTFLRNAEILEGVAQAAARGISFADPSFTVDMKKLVAYKDSVVKKLTGGVYSLLKSNGVEVFRGTAAINKDKDIVINGKEIIKADKIILAGGSKVAHIPIPGIEHPGVMTSDDILSLQEQPQSMVVIGGGVIGVEMAQALGALGTKVTIVEMADRIIPALDKEVSETLRHDLEKMGITVLTSKAIDRLEDRNGRLAAILKSGEVIEADKALLSIGRVPDLEGVGELDLEIEKGKVKVDKYMETSVKGVYAPGDINGIKMLAHTAFRMAEVAAENALHGNHMELKLLSAPSVVYTRPEVAMVGLTEEQAREHYGEIRVGKFPFAANGRALASGENAGFVKVILDNKYGEILGIHIIGAMAAEMISQASLVMEIEATAEEVLATIYGHPTYSEALYEAIADALGIAIHLPKKK